MAEQTTITRPSPIIEGAQKAYLDSLKEQSQVALDPSKFAPGVAGISALQQAAQRLKRAVRKTDYVARVGGDEFIAVLIDEEPHKVAEYVKRRLFQAASTDVNLIGDINLALNFSIAN